MKKHFYQQADIAGGSPVFWIAAMVVIILGAVFFIRQISFIPLDRETVTDFMLDEGKGKTSSYKKYFPKPYSVQDLAKTDA